MRLTAILFLSAALTASASGNSQTVTLDLKDVPIQKVFREVIRQTGTSIIYNEAFFKNTSLVTIKVKDAKVPDVLGECLKGLPFTFDLEGNAIVIKRSPPTFFTATATEPQQEIFSGRVTDTTGDPLEGASVAIKGSVIATQTNAKGEFELKKVNPGDTLVVSYIGYITRNVIVPKRGDYIFIILKSSNNELDKIIVEAYGTTSRRFNVGSISTVDAATIEKQPVTNPLLALEGQAPGLAINATSGIPGSQVLVQVRGQNTIADVGHGLKPYDQPLFIVDGVPFASQNKNVSQLISLASASNWNGGISQAGGISPFNNINPHDIQSISILKDADATSIYGSEGSNGVILITTKKGKPGKTSFHLSVNTGFNSDARSVQLLNTKQYLQLRKEAFAADGLTPSNDPNDYNSYAPDLTIFDQNKYTDWQKVIYGKTSNNTDVHGQLSGGNTQNTFLISAGYARSTYNFPGDYADQRWTMHSSFHHTSTDNQFTLDFITDYGYDQNNSPGNGGKLGILLSPNTPDLLDPDGNLVWSYQGVDLSHNQFYGYLKRSTDLQNYNLNSSLHLAYKILQGLTISANFGYNRNTTSEHSETPAASQRPLYAESDAEFANNAFHTINIEPQINYTKPIGQGVLSILLGATYKKNANNANSMEGFGYANDNFLGSINGAPSVYVTDNSSIYKYNAGFARLKYIYNQKYILELTGRRDGSSNFGPGRQLGNFGSLGAGWIFSEERGFKKRLPFISYGKLSGSYGTSGSDGAEPYRYQAFWTPIVNVPAFQGVQPTAPENLYNPNYSWALKKSLNLALDLGLFRNRILLNATFYRNREGNQLVGYPLPIQTGFSSVLENLIATVRNRGWEFSAISNNIKTKHFSWTTNFNISFNRNKLLSFPNLAASSYSQQYIIGKATSIVVGFRFKDVNPTTGLFEFYTADGQVVSDPTYGTAAQGGDYVPIANREVNYMGGFGNNLLYKNFSLYIFCQFSSQTAPNWLATVYSGQNSIGISKSNVPLQVLNDYWQGPGDRATMQKLTSNSSSAAFQTIGDFIESSGIYSNDTYLRLKTVALSYSLPGSVIKKLHIQSCSIYVNAQNLLTITNYKVGDPEQPGDYTSFPLQRIIAFGLNLNF